MLLYRRDFLQSSYGHKQGVSKTGVAVPKGRGREPEETPPLKQRETERGETPSRLDGAGPGLGRLHPGKEGQVSREHPNPCLLPHC